MRKTYGLIGIAAILLAGCGGADTAEAETTEENEMVRLSGGINMDAENVTLLNDELCVPNEPSLLSTFSDLGDAQVTVHDANGAVVATSDFQIDHNDDECNWFVDLEVESGSESFSADFLDMSTPVAQVSENVDGEVNLDFVTPISDHAEAMHEEMWDTPMPGN